MPESVAKHTVYCCRAASCGWTTAAYLGLAGNEVTDPYSTVVPIEPIIKVSIFFFHSFKTLNPIVLSMFFCIPPRV